MNRKLFLGILVSFLAGSLLMAKTEIEKMVEKARTKKGKIIYASPKGGNGTLTIMEAVKELRSGYILRLAPGRYQKNKKATWVNRINIDTDNITIEGNDVNKPCQLTIVLWGKNCIVRNIWISGIEGEGLTIVDSRINPSICSSGNFSKSYIYNCLIHGISIYPNNSQVTIENCTIVSMYTPPKVVSSEWKVGGGGAHRVGGYGAPIYLGQLERKGDIIFRKCIIYTNGFLFYPRWNISSLAVKFDSNIIWAGQGMFVGNKNVKKLKEIKSVCRVRFGGKNYEKKAELSKTPQPSWHGWYGYGNSSYYIPVRNSTADKKQIGCYIGGSGIPSPRPGTSSSDSEKKKKKKKRRK